MVLLVERGGVLVVVYHTFLVPSFFSHGVIVPVDRHHTLRTVLSRCVRPSLTLLSNARTLFPCFSLTLLSRASSRALLSHASLSRFSLEVFTYTLSTDGGDDAGGRDATDADDARGGALAVRAGAAVRAANTMSVRPQLGGRPDRYFLVLRTLETVSRLVLGAWRLVGVHCFMLGGHKELRLRQGRRTLCDTSSLDRVAHNNSAGVLAVTSSWFRRSISECGTSSLDRFAHNSAGARDGAVAVADADSTFRGRDAQIATHTRSAQLAVRYASS